MPKPGPVNSAAGVGVTILFVLATSTTPMLIAANPGMLGPEVFSGIIIWRLLSSAGIVFWAAEEVTARDGSWLTLEVALGAYGFAMVLCVIGLYLFISNMDEDFEKWRLYYPQSGKAFLKECWVDAAIWGKRLETKDDEVWGWVEEAHPKILPLDTLSAWLEELADKHAGGGGGRPAWLESDAFAPRIREVFRWKGDGGAVTRSEAALGRLFGEGGERGGGGTGGGASSKVAPTADEG